MTSIVDRPEDFAATALAGFCMLHPGLVRPVHGGAVRAAPGPAGKVAVVTGGGSGHFPAFAGYVGPGLADAAVAGDVFASPSTRSVAHVARAADRGGGVLLCFGNYAGDVLNFAGAAERLRAEGIDTRVLAVTDDVASAPADTPQLRRGVAGDLVVLKVAGAAAEAGLPLDEVERLARRANARTVTLGVAFSGCTLPGAAGPLFTVPEGRMAVGLGIHGEPGIAETDRPTATALADLLVGRLLAERPDGAARAAVALNGLGCTKHEELFVLWHRVAAALTRAGIEAVDPAVGELVTSLDMAGCSLTLTWLDAELEPLWRAPADSYVLRRGGLARPSAEAPTGVAEDIATAEPAGSGDVAPAGSEAGREAGRTIAALLDAMAAAMRDAEDELGRLDAHAGDGDHGMGMARGAAAAAAAARDACGRGAGAATVLARAGDAWADRAGGTSGALWGLMLRAWSGALDDDGAVTAAAAVAGARAGLQAVTRVGGAAPGDKTLVDALAPFVDVLADGVAAGHPLAEAWRAAAAAAERSAAATADMAPRLGRARPLAEKSLGHPDPGAVSLARCAAVVADRLERPGPAG